MAMVGPTTDHEVIRQWAEANGIIPVELLPHIVDHIPSQLELVTRTHAKGRKEMLQLSWEEFFQRFDLLGLSFVYDDASTGYNELLQIENKSPFRNPEYRVEKIEH